MNDNLPALKGTTSREMIVKHLNAIHKARKSSNKEETSEKICRASCYYVRPTGKVFQNGELVYFKREGLHDWQGPATVIGQEGKTIILKHASYIIRVY